MKPLSLEWDLKNETPESLTQLTCAWHGSSAEARTSERDLWTTSDHVNLPCSEHWIHEQLARIPWIPRLELTSLTKWVIVRVLRTWRSLRLTMCILWQHPCPTITRMISEVMNESAIFERGVMTECLQISLESFGEDCYPRTVSLRNCHRERKRDSNR